jgi:hypothetical protein
MKKNLRHSFPFLLALIFPAVALASDDYQKDVHKSMRVNANVNLRLDVNFAEVTISTWDQAQLDIDVSINAGAKSQERADQIIENIDVEIIEGTSEVVLNVRLSNTNCKNNEKLDIRVNIKMPVSGSISGKCSFGDVSLDNLSGACMLLVEYGDFRANALRSMENDIRTSFGAVNLVECGGGSVNAEYSDVEIARLKGNCRVSSDFGNIDIGMVDPNCQELRLDVEYGNAGIRLSPGMSYNFDAKAEYGHIDLPASAIKSFSDKDYTSEHFSGKIGSGSGGNLTVKSSFGNVDIVQ